MRNALRTITEHLGRVFVCLLFCAGFASLSAAQGYFYHDIAWRYASSGAFPASGATVTVCTSAGAGIPCSPLATIYTSAGLGTPAANPFTTDSMGNFGFWVPAAQTYIITVTGAGLTGYSTTFAAPIVSGGPANFTSLTATGNVTMTAGQNIYSAYSLNNVLWVDGIKYTTIQSCVNALPSTGGVCMVPPNYTETLSANLTLNKNYTMIHFACPWKVTAGTNQLIIPSGTRDVTIESDCAQGGGTQSEWNYTGSGKAWAIGDTSGNTGNVRIKNVVVDISGGANTASAIYSTALNGAVFDHASVFCSGSGNGQLGFVCDGTGSGAYCGDNVWIMPTFSSCSTGWLGTGNGINAANANVIIDPNDSGTTGGIAMDFEATSTGNTIIGLDAEAANIAFKFGGNADNNRCSLWHSSNTTDFSFGSGTTWNKCEVIGPHNVAPVVSDSGTNNTVNLQPTSGTLAYNFACNGTATASSTLYLNGPSNVVSGACTSLSANGQLITISSAGTIKNLYVNAVSAGVNGSSGVVTIQKCAGGTPGSCSLVNQSVTCTVGTSHGCSDTSHNFPVAAGDLMGVTVTTQGSETLGSLQVSFEKH